MVELQAALNSNLARHPIVVPILPQGNAFPDLSGRGPGQWHYHSREERLKA